MIVLQSGSFKRRVKKLHKNEKQALDQALMKIIEDPSIGDLKIGDLAGIQVFKYKHKSQLNLIGYQYIEEKLVLTFIEHGSHENFYRDLKT